jgi:hypothetical protein
VHDIFKRNNIYTTFSQQQKQQQRYPKNDVEILPAKITVEEIIRRIIYYVTTFEFLLRHAVNEEGFYTGTNIQYLERISNTKAYFDLQSLDLNQEFDVGKYMQLPTILPYLTMF